MKMTERNTAILEKVMTGMTLEDVGKEYGISKQRVRQIISVDPRFNQRDYGGRKGYRGARIDVGQTYKYWLKYLLKRMEQLEYEKPIMIDWYENGLSVREVMQKWGISLNQFRGILKKWQEKNKYYQVENEQ